MSSIASRPHTVVGVFPSPLKAYVAARQLDHAGVRPQDVSIVAGEPELAAEAAAHRHAPRAAIAGATIGALLGAAYVIFGASGLFADLLGVMTGIGLAAAAAVVGLFVGRAIERRVSRWNRYEHVVKSGGALIAVACTPMACEHAKEVLERSGAEEIDDVGEVTAA